MSDTKIKTLRLTDKRIEHCSGDIYKKLGLSVHIKATKLYIRSTKKVHIKSASKTIHVHIYDKRIVKRLIEEGFCRDGSGGGNDLEIVDELGNKISAAFIPLSGNRKIAVLTSGGDAPGMNGAIRAIVRAGKKWGSEVYGVYNGFDGLINDRIERLSWDSVGYHSSSGGTFLLSARSERFRTREGRKIAVYNLARREIDGLIVIGGDGSMNGGMVFKDEFAENMRELVEEGRVSRVFDLKLIVIPASIDNDISYSDMTLGADSALHRVVESVDSLISTMVSHQRSFVVEVMGRSCGWIALMASFAMGADYVFVPEAPHTSWERDLLESIRAARRQGKMSSFIVIAEGAVDERGGKIDANQVKVLIEQEIGLECRVIKLGHIQRGGKPSAFDRILSTLLGCKAVEYMMSDTRSRPKMLTLREGRHLALPLESVIKENQRIAVLQKERRYEEVLKARGRMFNRSYALSEQLRTGMLTAGKRGKLAVLHQGRRSGGMNVALHVIVRYAISLNQDVYVVQDGFEGLLLNQVTRAKTYDYITGIHNGGSLIGTSFSETLCAEKIYSKLVKHDITSLVVIGGAEALETVNRLREVIESKMNSDNDNNDNSLNMNNDNNLNSLNDNNLNSLNMAGGCKIDGKSKSEDNEKRDENSIKIENINKIDVNRKNNKKNIENSIENSKNNKNIKYNINNKNIDEIENSKNNKNIKNNINIDKIENNKKNNKKNIKNIENKENKGHKTDIVFIPATVDNNIPNTDMSLGADTALNCITNGCDFLRLSAMSMKETVFVVDVPGGACGYLALLGGIAAGAFDVFIPERKYSIVHLSETAERLKFRFKKGNRHGILLIKNQETFSEMSSDAFSKLIKSDSEGLYDAKFCVFGYFVEGGNPSPYDRISATILGIKSVDILLKIDSEGIYREKDPLICGVIGLKGQKIGFVPIRKVLKNFTATRKGLKKPKWLEYSNICRSIE